jgi:hypothetical protein
MSGTGKKQQQRQEVNAAGAEGLHRGALAEVTCSTATYGSATISNSPTAYIAVLQEYQRVKKE